MSSNNYSAKEKILFFLYSIVLLGLFLYSFTQIDLSLTFSRITFLRNLVKSFQYVGYFNRPLSTYLFLALVILLYGFYFVFLYLSYKKKIGRKFIWRLIIISTVLLAFSYNAFSYDLFNYMFDAKIITHYHQNPYVKMALDYPGDPMLSFMHWTQRTYPYGPVWLVLTVPLSFLGLQFFLPTFFLFKGLMGLSFLGSVFFIGKILRKIAPHRENPGLVFFGLSPLALIECLVSAHLDIVMIFLAIWAFYLLLTKKPLWSLLVLILSIGIKFATVFLVPVFFLIIVLQQRRKTMHWQSLIFLSVVLMVLTVLIASVRTNFQPWYLLLPLSFAAFLADEYSLVIPSSVISFFALMTYVPFLYLGNWNKPVPEILLTMYYASYALSLLIVGFIFLSKRIRNHEARSKVLRMTR